MNSIEKPEQRRGGRAQLLMIMIVFAGPLAVATWMYYSEAFLPSGAATNHASLLEPIINLGDELPVSSVHAAAPDQWLMLYATNGTCAAQCEEALYRLRQSRLMLGNDTNRVARVFLHGDSAPDTVFLEQQHAGLITMTDKALSTLLEGKRPEALQAGGIFLIDPLGNLVMYFPPDLNPKEMVEDLEHLLNLSRIG